VNTQTADQKLALAFESLSVAKSEVCRAAAALLNNPTEPSLQIELRVMLTCLAQQEIAFRELMGATL
jgi:hypothetical protein